MFIDDLKPFLSAWASTYMGFGMFIGRKYQKLTCHHRHLDTNCNGISGINTVTGLTWEEELCAGSGAKGIIYLGTGCSRKIDFNSMLTSPKAGNVLSLADRLSQVIKINVY